MSQRLTPGGLTQTFVGKDGERRNTYSLSEDGTLRLEVTVRSSRLPAPLEYDLTYERVGARGPSLKILHISRVVGRNAADVGAHGCGPSR